MSRYLIVIENKETGKWYLHSPFKSVKTVPDGFIKITSTMPLNEEKFGHLPLLDWCFITT
jgi:hypothetical protein